MITTTSFTGLAELLRFERTAPGGPAKAGRYPIGVALCTLALLAAAPAHAQSQGSLVSWGSDYYGGVSGTPAGNDYTAVSAGGYHSVAIRTDGTLVAWGGDNNGEVSRTPTTGTYTAVAAGTYHSVAIRTDGTLVSWGNYDEAVTRTPTTGTYTAVASGYLHSVALRTDGTLVSWGNTGVVPSGTYTAVSTGTFHHVAIHTDGTLASWGNNNAFGQVSDTPAGNDYTAVSAGAWHSVALRTDGTLVSWGWDDLGQVSGTPAGNDYTAVSAGGFYSVALRTDGTLVAWGGDYSGEVSGTPAGTYTAVAAGYIHSLAITTPQPIAIAGPNQTVDCTGPEGATVTLNGSASYDADGVDDLDYEWSVAEDSGVVLANPAQAITSGVFPVGVHEVTLTVYDIDEFGVRKGGVDVASVTIVVVDDMPPMALVTTNIASLWPANGAMIPVTIYVQASDTCSDPDDLVILCDVSSNQPDATNGSANLTGDVDGHDGYSAPVAVTLQNLGNGLYSALIYLRAERDPSANTGRIYSIGLSVMDGTGNIGNATTTVVVPHDGKK